MGNAKAAESGHDGIVSRGFIVVVSLCIHAADSAAVDNDLSSGIRAGFDQHRVHVSMGRPAGSLCLYSLCAPDFQSVCSHCAV